MLSVTLTRAALSLSDLVIGDAPLASGLYLPEDAIGAIEWDLRRTYAPDGAWRGGKSLLAVVREASVLPLVVYAKAATAADLATVKAILETAAVQWSFTVTIAADGVAEAFKAEPALPRWDALDSGMVRARMARAVLQIPINP